MNRGASILVLMAVVAALPGCDGSEAGDPGGPTVTLEVTRDFGRESLLSEQRAPLPDSPTVLRLLRDYADVATSSDRRYIEAIDDARRGENATWALNVNGREADVSPRDYKLHPGDVVQLDLRYWHEMLDVRATIGAFPETFNRGVFGRRFPVRVECADPNGTACALVASAMRRAGVATDGSRPPGPTPPDGDIQRARVLVGPWRHWRDRRWARWFYAGARYTGVFARFTPSVDSLQLFNWYNVPVRAAGAGTGLIGAMLPTDEDLRWFVTGVDEEGVERAARALDSAALQGAFAVAVTRRGIKKLPLPPVGPVPAKLREET